MNLLTKLQSAFYYLKNSRRVLVVGHVSPDLDALASIGAIMETLRLLGVEAQAYADNKLPHLYGFIVHEEKISSVKPADLTIFDVIVVVDCGSLARTGLQTEIEALVNRKLDLQDDLGNSIQKNERDLRYVVQNKPLIIEFDHHEPQDKFADLEIRLPNKASTTEIIYDFLQANNLEINKAIADCILAGLMADTGHFIHPNSSFQALAVSSRMLLKGASLNKISSHIRGAGSLPALKVWGRALEKLKLDSSTGFACTALTAQELENLLTPTERAASADVFGDVVSFISYLSGVKVSLFLREEDSKVKGSLRANTDDVDVAAIARKFGGGGHKRAAGFSLSGRLQETKTGWKIIKK